MASTQADSVGPQPVGLSTQAVSSQSTSQPQLPQSLQQSAQSTQPQSQPQQPSQNAGMQVGGMSGPMGELNQQIPLGLNQSQIVSLLRHLPEVFTKLAEQGSIKEDAAQTLSQLSQSSFMNAAASGSQQTQQGQGQPPPQMAHQVPIQPLQYASHPISGVPSHQLGVGAPMGDPGPSSHPRGPPNLGQLSALASVVSGMPQGVGQVGMGPVEVESMGGTKEHEMDEGASEAEEPGNGVKPTGGGRARGARVAAMGTDEWSRQRKDNHKEVERRRRGNINEGIAELGRIVPNSSGEKAKGAILSRAVQYIHHLKENEARNIEKWTLEKLLMDQAMGDLQAQLGEAQGQLAEAQTHLADLRKLWEEERGARQRAEAELEVLRVLHRNAGGAIMMGSNGRDGQPRSKSTERQDTSSSVNVGEKVAIAVSPSEGEVLAQLETGRDENQEGGTADASEGERPGKRQRVE